MKIKIFPTLNLDDIQKLNSLFYELNISSKSDNILFIYDELKEISKVSRTLYKKLKKRYKHAVKLLNIY